MDRFVSSLGYEKISEKYSAELQELYSYYKKVMVVLMRQGLSYEDAQDATQDTYIEAISYLPTLKDIKCLKSWLFTIAKRVGSKYVSRKIKNQETEEYIEEYDLDRNLALAISGEDEIEEALGISRKDELYANLFKLGDRERKILILHYIYRYDYKTISALLDINHATVRSISRRAKEKLRLIMLDKT